MFRKATPVSNLGTFSEIFPAEDLRWVRLTRGNRGDLVGFLVEPGEERGKVCLLDNLPEETVEGQFAVVNVTPTRSGRAYHAMLTRALRCRDDGKVKVGSNGKLCLFSAASLEAAEAALDRLLAEHADKAEADARQYEQEAAERQAAKAAFEAELAAMPANQAETGATHEEPRLVVRRQR